MPSRLRARPTLSTSEPALGGPCLHAGNCALPPLPRHTLSTCIWALRGMCLLNGRHKTLTSWCAHKLKNSTILYKSVLHAQKLAGEAQRIYITQTQPGSSTWAFTQYSSALNQSINKAKTSPHTQNWVILARQNITHFLHRMWRLTYRLFSLSMVGGRRCLRTVSLHLHLI